MYIKGSWLVSLLLGWVFYGGAGGWGMEPLPLPISFSPHVRKVVFINCEFLFLTRIDGLTVNITKCCIIYTRKGWAPSFRLSSAVKQGIKLLSQELPNILFLWGFMGSKNMFYKSLKFSKEWVYDFYPTPHHYLLVERGNTCIFSILLKSMWLESS